MQSNRITKSYIIERVNQIEEQPTVFKAVCPEKATLTVEGNRKHSHYYKEKNTRDGGPP